MNRSESYKKRKELIELLRATHNPAEQDKIKGRINEIESHLYGQVHESEQISKIEGMIFDECHSLCMDNDEDRRKMATFIYLNFTE